MSGHKNFSDLSTEIRKDPERAARIDALKAELALELAREAGYENAEAYRDAILHGYAVGGVMPKPTNLTVVVNNAATPEEVAEKVREAMRRRDGERMT